MRTSARLILAGCLLLTAGATAHAAVTYLGNILIDGRGTDLSGLSYTLEDGSPADGLDGFGSGISYTGLSPAPNVYRFVSIADRGPNRAAYGKNGKAGLPVDNTVSYPTRAQTWDFTVLPATHDGSTTVSAKLVKTTLFTDETGRNLVGRSDMFSSVDPARNLRFDPEAIQVAPDGTLFVSDEYGPSIYHFDENGKRIGIMHVPAHYQIQKPSPQCAEEIDENSIGRTANKGFEGLAITPDGSRVIAALQAPLLQDGGDGARFARLAIFDTSTGDLLKEVVYPLDAGKTPDHTNHSISDMTAINDHEMLVDERDGKKSKAKFGYIVDINSATDITGRRTVLVAGKLESAILPLKKKLLFDIKSTVIARDALTRVPPGYTPGLPEKIEGFAFGPLLPDGRRLFVVTNDDDFLTPAFLSGKSPTNKDPDGAGGFPNYFFIFAIDPADLPTFIEEKFTPAHQTAVILPRR